MKRFTPLALAFLSIASLASCAGPNASPKILLVRDDSRIVLSSYGDDGSALLPTYRHVDYADVPYVKLEDFFAALYKTELTTLPGKVEQLSDNLYAYSQNGAVVATFDPAKDIMTVKSFDSFHCRGNLINNGVGWDSCNPSIAPASCVRPSASTKIHGEAKDRVFEFGSYNFDMVEVAHAVYCPIQPLVQVVLADYGTDIIYNGTDFFFTMLLDAERSIFYPGAYSSLYARPGEFALGGKLFTSCDPVGETEKYRYWAEGQGGVRLFCFLTDGSVRMATAPDKASPASYGTQAQKITYTESDKGILVTSVIETMDMRSTFLLPKYETFFDSKVRSKGVAQHTYDLLRFQFDNIYGLKEDLYSRHGVTSMEKLIEKKGLKERLLSTDSATYDEALCELLMGNIDDGHTKYIGRCLYSGLPGNVDELVSSKMGPRRGKLFELREKYTQYRHSIVTKDDPDAKEVGVFFEGKTAVIRFDAFEATGIIANFPSGASLVSEDPAEAMLASSPDGFYLSMKEIEKHPEVENVVVDLTCNGGGAALTLPYLASIWTDDPALIINDLIGGNVKEFHYEVDFNRNGVFHDDGDTYMGEYEFFLLTSNFSFSCGNALPTMAWMDGIKIIGEQSGGGACPVASVSDGSGTYFNTSMPMQISYKDAHGNYCHNDNGIPVPEAQRLPMESWYDLAALDAFVSNL